MKSCSTLVQLRQCLENKQLRKAEEKLQLLSHEELSSPDYYFLSAWYAYLCEDYVTVIRQGQAALELCGSESWPECYALLGKAYGKNQQPGEALSHLKVAIEQGWEEPITHFAYGRMLMDLGELRMAHKHLYYAWKQDPHVQEYSINLLFATMLTPGLTDIQRASFFRNWAAKVVDPLLPQDLKHMNTPEPERKLRIGYVSGDFRYHAAVNPIYPLLRFNNREQFEIYAYSQSPRETLDEISEAIAQSVYKWVDIEHLSDRDLARRIRQDKIDILVDCSGCTQGSRLWAFALKPAPIQISSFGFIFTTGMQAIDYQFSDTISTPPARESLFTERMIHLTSQIHWRPLTPELDALPCKTLLPFERNGYITFGSGNATSKHNPEVIALWAAILRAVPSSKLHLKHFLFGDQFVQLHFRNSFARHGIDTERILFFGATKPVPHFQFYNEVDIALDPFPYTGGMTTCETLYMGVPLIALDGDGIRTSQSLLAVAGAPELIVATPDEYGRKAVALAGQPQVLKHYRQTLRDKLLASPIADTSAFVWEVEQAYRHIWRLWCESKLTT
jgi:protein O-GlcNAc transferase